MIPYFSFPPNFLNLLTFSALQLATGLPFLLILICLYLMPLGIYSPCIQKKEDLAPKPVFFAHRGAPMVGLNMINIYEYRHVWNMNEKRKP